MGVDLQDKSVLITGSTGLIGGGVARRLLQEDVRVRAMTRTINKAKPLAAAGAEVVQADMTDHASLGRAVAGCAAVVHCAGVLGGEAEPWAYFEQVNVTGTRALAQAALDVGVERFVHVSTVWVYGFDAEPDTDEHSPYRPSNDPYIDTKIAGERAIRDLIEIRDLPAIIIQPTEVYGPGDETWTLGPVRLIRSGKMILPAGGNGIIQPIYVDDVVDGIMATLRRGTPGEAYILTGTEAVTIHTFFGYFARMLGRQRLPTAPAWAALATATLVEWGAGLTGRTPMFTRTGVRGTTMRATYRSGETSKAYRELGFLPTTSVAEGMRAVETWLAREGYLTP